MTENIAINMPESRDPRLRVECYSAYENWVWGGAGAILSGYELGSAFFRATVDAAACG